ncbi:hypothetical protein JOM56_004808 [Amanita muscaria]
MIWKGLGLESPIVVVLRYDSDVALSPPNQRCNTGDTTIYKIPGADIPIVHHVLETHDVGVKDAVKT